MTIVSTGRTRCADMVGSTFTFFAIGTGLATSSIDDTDLASAVTPRRSISNTTRINNVVTLVGFLSPSQNNSASSITEIGFFDDLSTGNILLRSVASTNTWTSFTKDGTKSALIQVDLVFSS